MKYKKILSYAFSCAVAGLMIAGASVYAQEGTATSNESAVVTTTSVETTATTATVNAPVPTANIAYPVSELGGCANKEECHLYCEKSENIEACSTFAKNHGIADATAVARAKTLAAKIKTGKAPGKCNSVANCNQYCTDVKNIDECVTFAEQNGLKGANYNEGKKIQAFLKTGGTTPGNCQTNNECIQYCGQFSHAEECADFAQKAGITKGKAAVAVAQVQKLSSLAQSGQLPGGCSTKAECEKYCSDKTHKAECVDFAVQMGFVKAEVRQSGNLAGPGGCDSPESCQAFCADPANKDICLQYAKEHGLVSVVNALQKPVESQAVKVVENSSLKNLPQASLDCIKEAAPVVWEQINSGAESVNIDPGLKGKVTSCINKNKAVPNPKIIPGTNQASEVVKKCYVVATGSSDTTNVTKSTMTEEVRKSFTKCLNEHNPTPVPNVVSATAQLTEITKKCYILATGNSDTSQMTTSTMTEGVRKKFVQCVTENKPPVSTTPGAGGHVACTMEAKICPDGTSVGRVPPKCEFAPCGGSNVKCIADVKKCSNGKYAKRVPPNCEFTPCEETAVSNETVTVDPTIPVEGWDNRHPLPPVPATGTSGGAAGGQVMCTMEAKICPDGTSVGRVPPKCEFAPCGSKTTIVPPFPPEVPVNAVPGSMGEQSAAQINRFLSAVAIPITWIFGH